ncbi:putative transposase YdaD [Pullulanibacillus pueri]|uniref:Transposase n=1 Tax=Pullulanibacillus pueri TaxID=1437324 RepID=A0A8J2ZUC4_9BACL|nr:hypothetical protein [Pullulanibacillus pueri]MBM7681030.1 putative transposase YdaD [Pullulanibacillus pueri]GGH76769.1 hypothetical protein GCM10007096_07670 [Pullulanibacillus pueri]
MPGLLDHPSPTIKSYMEYLKTLETKSIERGLQKGLQEGRQKGKQEGRREGRLEGRVEGRIEGEYEAKKSMVMTLMENGVEKSLIKKATGFSEEQLNSIIEQMEK